jgi:hypothetical protein
MSDAFQIIESLDSEQLRATLARIDEQRSALIVLLRAAAARERKQRAGRKKSRRAREVQHA